MPAASVARLHVPAFLKRTRAYGRLRETIKRRFDPLRLNEFLTFAPPGHFYSPIPDRDLIARAGAAVSDPASVRQIPGIDLREAAQLDLLETLAQFAGDQPFGADRTPGNRYYFGNDAFLSHDALILYAMLRHYRPRQVIEVGCGYSSAVMLDTAERFLDDGVRFTFVEPDPARLLALMRARDRRHAVHATIVQELPVEMYSGLGANDILFIDSSHVAKFGSDVNHVLHHVLPTLQAGVVVHIHDICWPFEYPLEWLTEGRAWNEAYMVRAFLQFNESFRVLLFNSFIATHHRHRLASTFPLALQHAGASLWLQKVR